MPGAKKKKSSLTKGEPYSRPHEERREFTEKEIHQIEAWAAWRVPRPAMAAQLGLSDTWFEQLVRDCPAAQLAIRVGESKSATTVRATLYRRATGTQGHWVEDPVTRQRQWVEAVEPDQRALEFWCRTQEGMRTTERLEITGKDGVPVGEMTEEQANEKLERLLLRLKARNEGGTPPVDG